ncbi:uncharacterized protein F4812DRAFT_446520 [Daldinia caldariorum]|uniref:uncharacterized protein n=1 Tax=Daldinia caldariorum TaxID=326644 RepID=UPI0020084C0E|nr:uncharacterized protein F4812DRAFT_446520 [Daldinia caldariorum]KAI1463554.1 hypothetical protein F4812DRAFT_446520 [Daldinia caldariorum]
MLGSIVSFVPNAHQIGPPPKDVPPAIPIKLPQISSQLSDANSHPSLVHFLQKLQRPNELSGSHFAALGLQMHADAPPEDVVPDPSFLPVASEWVGVDIDEARRRDPTFRRTLSNGRISPEARVFIDRRAELSIPNQSAFRTIRRIKPEPGTQAPRLGNCYEFYRQMELMAQYWDDTSLPPLSTENEDESQPADGTSSENPEAKPKAPERVTYRTNTGAIMPAEFRHNLISSFVKLVAYDFGCNVVPPRVEPRLQLLSPAFKEVTKSKVRYHPQVASYFPSGCVFLCKSPMTREAARAGIVEGPIAAVSARNTINFPTSAEAYLDFGRELVAALITAQHRAREGQPEKRFGEGKWWATQKRWGGGEGGPIGREIDGDSIVGDKDSAGSNPEESDSVKPVPVPETTSATKEIKVGGKTVLIPVRGQPVSKKPRKNLSIYDSYRMVRLPSSNWDRKTKYTAVGKIKGADFDDVFVLSSLFHHLSVIRVRVPNRLLEVFAGAPDAYVKTETGEKVKSWGKLEVWRSKWYDLFIVEERLEAMRLLWGMMAWVMRTEDESGSGGAKADEDVVMKNA